MRTVKFSIIFLMAVLSSCSPECFRAEMAETAIIYFNPVQNGYRTKSIRINDSMIADSNVFIYDGDGSLVYSGFSKGIVSEAEISLFSGKTYRLYYVANCGNLTTLKDFNTASGADSFRFGPASPADENGAVPMAYRSEEIDLFSKREIDIPLTRVISRINIQIDKKYLPDKSSFLVKETHIRNVPKDVALFSESRINSGEECSNEGYSADADDILALNSGDAVSFHLFENCQGKLLPGNKSQSNKQFEENNPLREVCTFIELTADVNTATKHGSATYRFYPGEDLFTDFSIRRNTDYSIVVFPSEEGLSEESWRVDVSSMEDYITAIKLTATSEKLYTKGGPSSAEITASVYPSTASKALEISSSDESVIRIEGNGISAVGNGTAYIRARATDGSGICDSILISVIEPELLKLEFGFNKFYKGLDTDAILTAEYSNGFSENVSSCAEWSFDNSMLSLSNSKFTVTGSGEIPVSATYTYKGKDYNITKNIISYDISSVYLDCGFGRNYIMMASNVSSYRAVNISNSVYCSWTDGYSRRITDFSLSNAAGGIYINGNTITSNGTGGNSTFRINWKEYSTKVNVYAEYMTLKIWCKDVYSCGEEVWLFAIYEGSNGQLWVDELPGERIWTTSNTIVYIYSTSNGDLMLTSSYKTGTCTITINHEGNTASRTITIQ